MPWHFPDQDDDEEPVVIEGWAATAIFYGAVWLLITGLWKTIEVLGVLGRLIKWP